MLLDKGEAYYCFCGQERLNSLKRTVNGEEIMTYDKHCLNLTKEEVEANLKAGMPFVIRQNNPSEGKTTFHDEIYGDISVDNSELDDMVLIKSDGYPTYNFANVVDDHLQELPMLSAVMSIFLPPRNITVFTRHSAGKCRSISLSDHH